MSSRGLASLSVAVVAGALVATGVGLPSPAGRSDDDSLTVRLMFKHSGGWGATASCGGPNWGWDSLTFRVLPGAVVPYSVSSRLVFDPSRYPGMVDLRLGRRISRDSTWFLYKASVLSRGLGGRERRSGFDSLIISRSVPRTLVRAGGDVFSVYRVGLVDPWPEPPRPPVATQTIRGRVLDDSTGCPVFFSEIVVDGTSISARTDTLGTFLLREVPHGGRGLGACASGYIRKELVVSVPSAPLEIRLRREPGYTNDWPCWGNR